MIELYCDGACSGNPGVGGWGFLIKKADNNIETYKKAGYCSTTTTNNRMEISACLYGLMHIYPNIEAGEPIRIITDSQYVINTMTKGWARNKNSDLWDLLDGIIDKINKKGCTISWRWVKGHASNQYNAMCDTLAVNAYRTCSDYADPEDLVFSKKIIQLEFSFVKAFNENIDIYSYRSELFVAELNKEKIIATDNNIQNLEIKLGEMQL